MSFDENDDIWKNFDPNTDTKLSYEEMSERFPSLLPYWNEIRTTGLDFLNRSKKDNTNFNNTFYPDNSLNSEMIRLFPNATSSPEEKQLQNEASASLPSTSQENLSTSSGYSTWDVSYTSTPSPARTSFNVEDSLVMKSTPIAERKLETILETPKGSNEKRYKRLFCKFCMKNGEPHSFYLNHNLKKEDGTVICPVLRNYTCPLCGVSGDNAHTRKYCPEFLTDTFDFLPIFRRLSSGELTTSHNHK